MNITALATHARLYVEKEYKATISTQDAFAVAAAAASYVTHRADHASMFTFVKDSPLRGKPPLEDAFFDLVENVLKDYKPLQAVA